MRERAVDDQAVCRQARLAHEVLERPAADDLQPQRRLLGEGDRAGLEQRLDSVPGLQTAAEAGHERAVGALVPRAKPFRRDCVGYDFDPLGRDALRLEPAP